MSRAGGPQLEAVVEHEEPALGDLAIEVPGGMRLSIGSADQAVWAGEVLSRQ